MKKIILLLFLFCLLFACYYVYKTTEESNLDIALIGDSIADNPYLINMNNVSIINNDFINKDYHITDLLNIIRYNQELKTDDKYESIHKLLNDSDIILISIGMNDLYYKLGNNTKEIYTYLNDIVNNYEQILLEISRYDYKKVYVLGYYNIGNNYNDIFTYINYKVKNITNKYGFIYLDLNKYFYNDDKFYLKKDNFCLNKRGYRKIYELIVENLENY